MAQTVPVCGNLDKSTRIPVVKSSTSLHTSPSKRKDFFVKDRTSTFICQDILVSDNATSLDNIIDPKDISHELQNVESSITRTIETSGRRALASGNNNTTYEDDINSLASTINNNTLCDNSTETGNECIKINRISSELTDDVFQSEDLLPDTTVDKRNVLASIETNISSNFEDSCEEKEYDHFDTFIPDCLIDTLNDSLNVNDNLNISFDSNGAFESEEDVVLRNSLNTSSIHLGGNSINAAFTTRHQLSDHRHSVHLGESRKESRSKASLFSRSRSSTNLRDSSGVVKQISQQLLSCGICLGKYNLPKVLPCLHTFCQDCLTSYVPTHSLAVTCPICRSTSILPLEGVPGLQTNFFLNNLMDVVNPDLNTSHRSSSASGSHGQGGSLLCTSDSCGSDDSRAISKCLDCDIYLCEHCEKAHPSSTMNGQDLGEVPVASQMSNGTTGEGDDVRHTVIGVDQVSAVSTTSTCSDCAPQLVCPSHFGNALR